MTDTPNLVELETLVAHLRELADGKAEWGENQTEIAAMRKAAAEITRLAEQVKTLRADLALILDRALKSTRLTWIEDSAAIHSIAYAELLRLALLDRG